MFLLYAFLISWWWLEIKRWLLGNLWNKKTYRNRPPKVFLGKGVLKLCSKFTREHPCRSVISINLLWISYCNCNCCPVNLLHIFRTPFPKNTSGGLPLLQPSLTLKRQVLRISLKKDVQNVYENINTKRLDVFFFIDSFINLLKHMMLSISSYSHCFKNDYFQLKSFA